MKHLEFIFTKCLSDRNAYTIRIVASKSLEISQDQSYGMVFSFLYDKFPPRMHLKPKF